MTPEDAPPAPSPPTTFPLDPLVYFKLKARMLELQLQEAGLINAKAAAFRAAGLEPANYALDDATCTLRRVE